MKNKILKMLKTSEDYISGEIMCQSLNVTRASIWKHIRSLRSDGYVIDSVSNKGYKLISCPDLLTASEVNPFLSTDFIGRSYYYFDSIESTNTKAKELYRADAADGSVIVSEEQTAGRGRLGRRWISPKNKGIFASILLRPTIDPLEAYKLTVISAAAVYNALSSLNINSLIKWPNDIIIDNKKVCGILTEMSAELNLIHYIVVGIGVNVNTDLKDIPEDLQCKASSLKIQFNQTFDRQKLLAEILNHFEILYKEFLSTNSIKSSVEICKKNSAILNKKVILIEGKKSTEVTPIDINDAAHIIVRDENKKLREILSAEISIRTSEGYV
ncbi:biotin--[acetyl-CoA-carboxylase] ligase [Clostridium oryzae]|nr:biotin--[acetyl-CoA-carboxylase] ligase [Clostridium oryzae]